MIAFTVDSKAQLAAKYFDCDRNTIVNMNKHPVGCEAQMA